MIKGHLLTQWVKPEVVSVNGIIAGGFRPKILDDLPFEGVGFSDVTNSYSLPTKPNALVIEFTCREDTFELLQDDVRYTILDAEQI